MLYETPEVQNGFRAPEFTLADPDGNTFMMSEQLGEKGLLIAFLCNHCPYVQAIAGRLADDARQLQTEGINVLAVMSNDYSLVQADSPRFMKKFAARHSFSFPYLVDEHQSVGKAYSAVCTPDFFGFNRHGELQYRGRLDDARMGNPQNRTRELVNAMRLIAATDKGPAIQHPSMGCSIKWN